MTTPTNVDPFVDSSTIISAAWLNGINDWVYGSYGLLGETFTAAAFRTALDAASNTGTTTNDDAAAGKVGERLTASLASGSAVTLSNGVAKTVVSRELTAGDWEVEGLIIYDATVAITSLAAVQSCLSDTTDTMVARKSSKVYIGGSSSFGSATAGAIHEVTPTTRFSLAATATVYLVAFSYFTAGAGSLKAYGDIAARRAR